MALATTARFSQFVFEVEWTPGSGIYSRACGLTDLQFTRTANVDTTEVPDCDDEDLPFDLEKAVRSLEFAVSASGVWARESHEALLAWFYSGETKKARIGHLAAGDGATEYEGGDCILSGLNNARTKGQKVTAGVELMFAGDVERIIGYVQYVGGHVFDLSDATDATTVSLSGVLTGGLSSSPQAGDFCIVSYSQAGTADRTARAISNAAGAFTSLMTQYVNDTNDTSITIKHKFLESPIDFELILGDPVSSGNGVAVNVQVFRNVDVSSPFDVAFAVAALTDTGRPNPPPIQPISIGAMIGAYVAAGLGADISSAFTASGFDAFASTPLSAINRSHTTGFGRKLWLSGAFDPPQCGGPTVDPADTSIGVTFALRPR